MAKVLEIQNAAASSVIRPAPQVNAARGAERVEIELPSDRNKIASVRITLPLPAAALHPNSRSCWQAKARAVKKSRGDAKLAALAVVPSNGEPLFARATVQATFYFTVNRRRDGDGLNSSLKSVLDGLADAGVVANDEHFKLLPPLIVKDAKPRVEIEITELGA